jgi:hypothetical protein
MLTDEGIQMYAQLLGEGSVHKSKTRMCAWITDKYAQDKNLKSSLDQLKAALKVLTLLALRILRFSRALENLKSSLSSRRRLRYSLYLLYWHKSTNTDAAQPPAEADLWVGRQHAVSHYFVLLYQ